MIPLASLPLFLVPFPVGSPGQEQGPPGSEPARPAITLEAASVGPVTIHYLTIPWGPNTFAAMEEGGDSFYANRSWPFARIETRAPVTLVGTRLPAGNYALVFHPNTKDKQGMSLEVRKIQVSEFLQPGNVMTPTPEGETLARAAVRFETAPDSVPALRLELTPAPGGASLLVRYGDRRLRRELSY